MALTKFRFKAITASGETYEGVRESTDKFSLYAELKGEGSTLITAAPEADKKGWVNAINEFLSGVSEHEKIIFTKNMGAMIDAGLSMAKSLAVLEKQTKNMRLKAVIQSIGVSIRKGQTFSDACALYPHVFSSLFVSMVRAGEESGKLSESLGIVAEQMDRMYTLKTKIRGAMIYPSVILSVMCVVGILMLIFVVPTLVSTFQSLHVQLPVMTQILIDISNFLQHDAILAVGILVALVAGVYSFAKTETGVKFFDSFFLHLPVIGELVRETNAARLSRTLASLLSSGVPFAKAITITTDVVGSEKFKVILREAAVKVEKGETMSSIFLANEKICPDFVGEMMSVGEETGRLPMMLLEVAKFYEASVDEKTKDISTIIEPALMIIIGVVVGFFALSMIKPIYSVMDSFGS